MALIAWYKLDGDTKNSVGNGYDGSIINSPVSEGGRFGQSYKFKYATADGISIPSNFAGLSEYSISLWVKPVGNHWHYNGSFISSGNWNGTCWAFGASQDNTQIDVAGRGYNKWISYTLELNVWTHLVTVVKNNIATLYANGVLIGTRGVTGLLASDASNTTIGRETYAGGHFGFNGNIDDVRIFNHALTETQVARIYGKPKKMLLHLPLNKNSIEEKTNSYTLTPQGTVTYNSSGIIGGSYDFSAGSLNLEYRNLNIDLTRDVTVSFWANAAALPSSRMGIFQTSYGGEFAINVDNYGSIQWYYGTSGIQASPYTALSTTSGVIEANKWVHITLIRDIVGNRLKIYKDGLLIANGTLAYIPAQSTVNLRVGYSYTGYFNGRLSDFRIYSYVLDESKIKELAMPKILHYKFDSDYEEATENLIPNSPINSYPKLGNSHGVYDTFHYNNNNPWSIGNIVSVSNNILTTDGTGRTLYTYDCIRPETSGGGLVAGVDYFVRSWGNNQFSFHQYNASQNGTQAYINSETNGFQVHYSVDSDSRININPTNFPTSWKGAPHRPNQSIIKQIIPNCFNGHECVRIVTSFRNGNPGGSYMAYGVTPSVVAGEYYAFSFYARAVNQEAVGKNIRLTLHTSGGWSSGPLGYGYASDMPLSLRWKKYEMIALAPNSGGTLLYFSGVPTGLADYEITEIQCERKLKPTSFTAGSRTGAIIKDSSQSESNGSVDLTYTPKWIKGDLSYGAMWFDGSGDSNGVVPGDNIIVDENLTNTNNYPQGCTYSFWINVDTDAPNRMSLLYGSSTIRHIEINSTSKNFRTEAALQNNYSFGAGTFPDNVRGEWSHFVIVFANDESGRPVRWYQNGKLFHTGSLDGGANPGTEYFSFNRIGRSTGSTSYVYAPSFKGKIDEFAIFAKALTEEEIGLIYKGNKQIYYNKNLSESKIIMEPNKGSMEF